MLSVQFGGLAALSRVNFAVERGKTHAIIGPNGAGKSTFFNCLTGVLTPTGGRIFVNDEDITGLSSDKISRKGIARSYQITNILPNASVLENVRIAAQSRRHGWNMIAHHSAFADINEKAQAALASVGLLDKAEELASNLSHGAQRNLEIGIALATEPQLLCLDEPTAGMSAAETRETMDLVTKSARTSPSSLSSTTWKWSWSFATASRCCIMAKFSRRARRRKSSRIPGCWRFISRHERQTPIPSRWSR